MNSNLIKRLDEIPEIFHLEDFTKDNRWFIDPYRINQINGIYIPGAEELVKKYFELFFKAVKTEDKKEIIRLGRYLHEINDNRLGYTSADSDPCGKGFCCTDLLDIYEAARENDSLIDQMPDILVFARGIGPDKISDLTTNIIYEHLYAFTEDIIQKYELDMKRKSIRRYVWNAEREMWTEKRFDVPLLEGKPILFIPNEIVCKQPIFSYERVYSKCFMKEFRGKPDILGITRKTKKGLEADCKIIREKYPECRDTVEKWSRKYRSVYERYRNEMVRDAWRSKYIGR